MARKLILLDLLKQEYEVEKDFIASLTDEDKARTGSVDYWSDKDVIAHIAVWKNRRVSDVQAVVKGGEPTNIQDFDHENELIFNEYRDQSWDEVIVYAEQAHQALYGQLQKLSEDELNLPWSESRPVWRVIVGNGYIHPILHIVGHCQAKGDLQRAGEFTALLGEPMAELDDSAAWRGTNHYNLACSYSLLGKKEEAITELGEALALTPNLVEWSKQDPDLDSIRGEAAYQALYEH